MSSSIKSLAIAIVIAGLFSITAYAQEPQVKGMEHKGMVTQERMKVGDNSNQMQNVMHECIGIVKNLHGSDSEHMQKMMDSGMMSTVMAMFETAKDMQKMMQGIESMKQDQKMMNDPQKKKHIEQMEEHMQKMMQSMEEMVKNMKSIEEQENK
ncbi:hypothetical protein [Caldithrix abyssi]|uniref:Uncharacterized protein n=1 Tax=Caldithrix abyssi DSM 13497 TaxID=880073 RepID=H1XVM3_CALAY|nr:hypothetical protein [Caldithrix abyssi]APF18970.1 hypothetical protein Cabys_2221 [Caldithrix abyssi DSM 13497]EHO42923.1 hypothetical protein Calab_3319 [Caldithrix abyssi DSM 13497]